MMSTMKSKPFCVAKRDTTPMTAVSSPIALEAECVQQIAAALLLARKICGRVVRSDVRIGRWIPLVVVHAIQNAEQIASSLAEGILKAVAELRRLNLFSVSRGSRW